MNPSVLRYPSAPGDRRRTEPRTLCLSSFLLNNASGLYPYAGRDAPDGRPAAPD